MKKQFHQYKKPIPDLNAFREGYALGKELALSKEKLNMKLNPFSPFFHPKAYISFRKGLNDSYEKWIRLKIDNEAYQQLQSEQRYKQLSKPKSQDLERER